MAPPPRPRLWLAACVAAACCAGPADAGWISIKNETPQVLSVQESVNPLLVFRRPKVWRLLPGTEMRECRPCGAEMKVQIYDARRPAKPIEQGTLKWQAADVALKFVPTPTGVAVTFTGPAVPAPAGAAPFLPADK